MTPLQMEAEIARLQQQQADQKKHWLRWGLASYAIGIALCVAVLIRVALTGADPAPPIIFIVLTFIYFGSAFTTAGRSPALRRFRSR
jgi:uncharacterized RDD family membrane protein YckC